MGRQIPALVDLEFLSAPSGHCRQRARHCNLHRYNETCRWPHFCCRVSGTGQHHSLPLKTSRLRHLLDTARHSGLYRLVP